MKMLLFKLILRLFPSLNPDTFRPKPHDERLVRRWLAESYRRDEFRAHFAARDYELMKAMAGGTEGKEYWVAYGRRMELLELLSRMRTENMREERERKKG